MCSNLSQTNCQKQNFLSISGEVNFQPACLSYSYQHRTPWNHTFFHQSCLVNVHNATCTCGIGHCSGWLDAVYRVPGSTSVWTVQHTAGPPSRGHLLFTQPHCLGPCPVLDRNCMFHRIWRSVLQMHSATYTAVTIHWIPTAMVFALLRCDGVSISSLILTFWDSLWVQFSRVTQSNGLRTYTK